MDLPGWQALRSELHGQGIEVVIVGLEMGGVDVLRPFIEDAHPEHPSLVDQTHRMDRLFGVTNIPSGIWIDGLRSVVARRLGRWVRDSIRRPVANALDGFTRAANGSTPGAGPTVNPEPPWPSSPP